MRPVNRLWRHGVTIALGILVAAGISRLVALVSVPAGIVVFIILVLAWIALAIDSAITGRDQLRK
jgi:hypothetical protein